MKNKLVIIGLAVLLTAGCKTPEKQINLVHLGMTEAEVVKILGEPESVCETHEGKTLNYSLAEMYVGFIPYSVKLVNGKVDSYGRDSGATQTRQPTPVIVPVVH